MAESKIINLDHLPKMMVILTGPNGPFLEVFLSLIPTNVISLSKENMDLDGVGLKPFAELDPRGKQIRIDQRYTRALNSGAKIVIINVPDLTSEDYKMYERLAKANDFSVLRLSGDLDIPKEVLEMLEENKSPVYALIKPEAPVVTLKANISEEAPLENKESSTPWWKKW